MTGLLNGAGHVPTKAERIAARKAKAALSVANDVGERSAERASRIPSIDIDVPNDPLNEQVVLAAMMADDLVRGALVAKLRAENFYAEEHREIFRGLIALSTKGLAFDPATLARLTPEVDVRIVEQLVAARPDVPDNLDFHVETLRWDATRATAARGPLSSFLEAFQDPRTAPERLRTIAKQLGESFEHGASSASPFTFRFAADIAAPREPVALVIPQFGFGPGRPSMITSYAGTGKTMLMQDLLLAVASGSKEAWGGALRVARHGRVRHLDYEMGAPLLDDRFQRLAYARKINLARLGDKLGSCSMPRMYLSSDAAEVEEALVALLTDVVLCTIDNLAAATPHAPKGLNDASIRVYLDVLTRVSLRTGCTFIVLTHDGKSGSRDSGKGGASLQRMRNSSAIADAAANVLSISANAIGELKIEQTKASLAAKGEPVTVRFVDVGEEYLDKVVGLRKRGIAISKVEVTTTETATTDMLVTRARAALLAALGSDSMSTNDLLAATKGRATAKLTALKELKTDGDIIEVPSFRGKVLRRADAPEDDNQGAEHAF